MTPEQAKLWERIRLFSPDEPGDAYIFSERLAYENRWSYEYALRALEEYKRFMFLICASGQQLTPSDQVDQVWHLHLLYTKSYWDEFCETILGRKVHHMPTRGGQQESARFQHLYRQTLDIYRHFSGRLPREIYGLQRSRQYRQLGMFWLRRLRRRISSGHTSLLNTSQTLYL